MPLTPLDDEDEDPLMFWPWSRAQVGPTLTPSCSHDASAARSATLRSRHRCGGQSISRSWWSGEA